jgi:hypothetical protein
MPQISGVEKGDAGRALFKIYYCGDHPTRHEIIFHPHQNWWKKKSPK